MNDEIKECLDSLYYQDDYCSISYDKLLEYITNLQQENEYLNNEFNNMTDYAKDLEDYKSRCEKATEITENLLKTEKSGYYQIIFKQQLNILQNGSEKDDR